MIKIHNLKLRFEFADAVLHGDKYFEVREAELVDMLEELKWYREQNLIRRDFAVEEIRTQGMSSATLKLVLMERIARIPKAEPPKERNGDCETCKHYYRQGELTYGFCGDCIEKGMGKYEPYIPKENE